jgi:hypothetical protein
MDCLLLVTQHQKLAFCTYRFLQPFELSKVFMYLQDHAPTLNKGLPINMLYAHLN